VSPIELGNTLRWYLDLLLFAKREGKQRNEYAEYAESGHPPDVPDQGKAGDDT
jgi:hypothetical protein